VDQETLPQEAAMFPDSPRNRIRAVSAAVDVNSHRKAGAALALAVSQALFVAVTAALFIAWLTIAH
jgi:hypothetical protein